MADIDRDARIGARADFPPKHRRYHFGFSMRLLSKGQRWWRRQIQQFRQYPDLAWIKFRLYYYYQKQFGYPLIRQQDFIRELPHNIPMAFFVAERLLARATGLVPKSLKGRIRQDAAPVQPTTLRRSGWRGRRKVREQQAGSGCETHIGPRRSHWFCQTRRQPSRLES